MNRPTEPSLHDQTTPATTAARRRAWLWPLVIALLAVGGYFAYRQFAPAPDAAPATATGRPGGPGGAPRTPVVAVPARTADVDVYLNALGTVTPLRTVTVRSRVEGQLLRVLFEEGQVVKEGQLLAEIDPRAVPGAADAVRGTDGARPRAARERAARPRALPHAVRAGLDREAAGRHAGGARAPVRRRGEGRPEPDRQRPVAARLRPHHRPDRRPGGPAPRRPRQHRARRRRERARGDHAARADRGGVHRSAGQPAGGDEADAVGREDRRSRPGTAS